MLSGGTETLSETRRFHVSKRQGQILALVAEGLSDKEIARNLGLSAATVKTYLNRVYRTNGLRNRTQAAATYLDSRPTAA